MGLPYVLSSDLVSAYPAKSLSIAEYVDGQIPLLAMTQNAQTGVSYSFVLTDFTKLVTTSNAGAVAVTLPLESSVAWPAGTQLRILNIGAGTVTVAGAVGVTITGTPLTLAQFKAATLVKTGTNTWSFLPFTSGVGAAVYSDANTGSYTGYAYKTFTASGTLNVTTAGFADLCIVAGGGGGRGAGGGGGAGGVLEITNAYLPVGTLTCTVGAGGSSAGGTGQPSRVNSYYAVGGGVGIETFATNNFGGSGAGGQYNASPATGQSGTPGQGNNGGNGSGSSASGGGGGAGAVGSNGVGAAGGNGGAGVNITLAGTTPSGAYVAGNYAVGGGGGGYGSSSGGTASFGGGAGSPSSATAGSANTGGGGGTNIANGGSGIIIVRVAV